MHRRRQLHPLSDTRNVRVTAVGLLLVAPYHHLVEPRDLLPPRMFLKEHARQWEAERGPAECPAAEMGRVLGGLSG